MISELDMVVLTRDLSELGQASVEHFADSSKMVGMRADADRRTKDYQHGRSICD
ncbi:MAG: hypothetical protein ACJ8G4_20035 [Burkholderiales bacterium]